MDDNSSVHSDNIGYWAKSASSSSRNMQKEVNIIAVGENNFPHIVEVTWICGTSADTRIILLEIGANSSLEKSHCTKNLGKHICHAVTVSTASTSLYIYVRTKLPELRQPRRSIGKRSCRL